MEYHPDLNNGDSKKTEMFKRISIAFQTILTNMESNPHYSSNTGSTGTSTGSNKSNNSKGKSWRTTAKKPPSPYVFNVKAWEEAHYGNRTNYKSNSYDATINHIHNHNHPANNATNTNNAFFKGMENNKAFQYSQRMERKEWERNRSNNNNNNNENDKEK